MRTDLEDEDVGSRLTKAERGHKLGRLGVAYLWMAHRPNAESFLSMAESVANDCKDQESAGLWLIYRGLNLTISGDLQAAKKCLDVPSGELRIMQTKPCEECRGLH